MVLLGLLAACALAADRATDVLAPGLRGAPRALALTVTGSTALLAAVIVPGALGLLRPLALLLTAGLIAAGANAWAGRKPRAKPRVRASTRGAGGDSPRDAPRREGGGWLLPGAAALVVAGCAIALVRDVAGAPVSSIDALNFQVPIPARWIQHHDVWGLQQFIPDYSNATYPHHGNALIAAVTSPFHSPFLARLVAVPYWAMAAVAVYALARELGAPRPGSVAAATAFAALPVSIRAGLEGAQTDMPMLAWLGAGALFLLRHQRSGRSGDLVLAGLGLGLALGTKWYALTTLVVVLALWALARRRDLLRPGAALLGLMVAAGGFWFARNWVETGNPLFPQPLRPLFDAPPDTLREQGGFTIAHYLFDGGVWRDYLWPAFRLSFGLAGAAIVAFALLGARRAPLLAMAALALVAVYFVTPYSAFGPEGRPVLATASTRYALPALMAAAAVAARGRWAAPLLAIGALDGARRGFDLDAGKVLLGMAVALVLYALARRPQRALAVALAAGILIVVVSRDRADEQDFGPLDPTLAYIERNAPTGRDIGLAGIWSPQGVSPVLPAFGPRLGNRVEYVGEFEDGMLRRIDDQAAWTRAARTYDLLIVGTAEPRDLGWAEAAGFRRLAGSERLVLYGVQSP